MSDKALWIPPAGGGVSGGVIGDETGLKVIRGTVSGGGAIVEGTGYTPTAAGTGQYDVDFTTDFTDVPSILVTQQANASIRSIRATFVTVGGFSVAIFDNTTGALTDCAFAFMAIGPA